MGSQKRRELVVGEYFNDCDLQAGHQAQGRAFDTNVATLAVNGNWMQFKKSTWFKGGTGNSDGELS